MTEHVYIGECGVPTCGRSLPTLNDSQLDGVAGQDLVIETDRSPASFVRYAVITDRDGHLTNLPSPAPQGWFVGGFAAGGNTGFACDGTTLVALQSHTTKHQAPNGSVRYATVRTTYRYADGSWAPLGRRVTRGQFNLLWNCAGLRRLI